MRRTDREQSREFALDLIDRCTKLQLSPEHLLDVVHDFLALQAGTA